MNKPAAKEPSMDEILSSIRQIIADDDVDPASPALEAAEPSNDEDVGFDIPDAPATEDVVADATEEADDAGEESEALELSTEQIVADDAEPAEDDSGFDIPDMDAVAEDTAAEEEVVEDSEEFSVPELVVPDDISFDSEDADLDAAIPEDMPVADAAPMPDPDLTADMAEELLEPATDAAVKGAFAKLGNIALGANNLTIENMIREMLRPMLKEWLDENLPVVVEKMVEKEIDRLSRGG